MEPEGTSFFISRRFKWLCYLVAASVVCFYFGSFFFKVIAQAQHRGLDGPMAWNTNYAFGLDDLVLALIPAAILISEFKVVTGPRTYHVLRVICIGVGIIAALSCFFFLREILHLLNFDSFELGLAAFVLRQISIILAATLFYHRISIHGSEADNPYA